MSRVITLDLNNFYLRSIQLTDVPAWYAYLSIAEVVEHTSWNLASQGDLERLVLAHLESKAESTIRFAIIEKASDMLVGTIGFHSISSIYHCAELAYDIHPDFWRRGIATVACKLVVKWGQSVRNFSRIEACVLDTNSGSVRVLEKTGFCFESVLRNHRMVRGTPRDFLLYFVTSQGQVP